MAVFLCIKGDSELDVYQLGSIKLNLVFAWLS
jgi:hypothetical protein